MPRGPTKGLFRSISLLNTAHKNCLRGLIQCALDLHFFRGKLRGTLLVTQLIDFLCGWNIQNVSIFSGASFHAVGVTIYAGFFPDLAMRPLDRALAVSDYAHKSLDRCCGLGRSFLLRGLLRRTLQSQP